MPNNIITTFAEKTGKSIEQVEDLWDKAKEVVLKKTSEYDEKFYPTVVHVLKKMLHLNENGEINPLSQFMIQILTSVSEMERTTIRQRIKSGYEQYRNGGGKVGRKDGFKKDDTSLLTEYKDVVKLLKQDYSVRKIMKLTDRSSGTIMKVKRVLNN